MKTTVRKTQRNSNIEGLKNHRDVSHCSFPLFGVFKG